VVDIEMPANWKRALEAFIEVYHVPFLHGKSTPKGVLETGLASYGLFERNSMLVCPLGANIEQLRRTQDHHSYALVNYLVYPFSVLNCLPTSTQAYSFTPLAVDRTRMRLWMVHPPGGDEEFVATRQAERQYVEAVFNEDVFICGEQRATAKSAGNVKSLLSEAECRIAHLFDVLERDIRTCSTA
jgi:phenylpropionate dioxygenase-like ring-hydroxylating dioxygenase large terminal subunit